MLSCMAPARADIDYLCLKRCTGEGTESGACMKKCSYDTAPSLNDKNKPSSHRILSAPSQLDNNKSLSRTPKSRSAQTDPVCLKQCTASGVTYAFCEKKCSKVDDGALILH